MQRRAIRTPIISINRSSRARGAAVVALLPNLHMFPDCYSTDRFRRAYRRAFGFTLLELLVVVVIIGLLVSYVGPKYFGQIGKSEVKVARAQIDALEKSIAQYRLDVGRFPSTEIGLNGLVVKPPNESKWAGPYLSKAVPLDPWGRPYIYKCCPGDHGDFDLYSLGKDGQPGGTGEAADVTNWSN